MSEWARQYENLILPAARKSKGTRDIVVAPGAVREAGRLARSVSDTGTALVMADDAGFGAAGAQTVQSLQDAGYEVRTLILPNDPLPAASVEESEPFRAALAEDPGILPVSVGSGVINDLVKYAAFRTDRRYLSVATAVSMDGYTSAGAPLSRDGFKVTIQTRAPAALIADLDVLMAAPAEMTGWGYGDMAGKSPAGGDWILADLAGAEAIDDVAFPMVQDHLHGWLSRAEDVGRADPDAIGELFTGLTAVGYAMEFHDSSRPASGADHQIAHLWEMEGLKHKGRKVSHGGAVAVATGVTLAFYDWLVERGEMNFDAEGVLANAPTLEQLLETIDRSFADTRIAAKAKEETVSKVVSPAVHAERLRRIKDGWSSTRSRLEAHLIRHGQMQELLRAAGAPVSIADIGVTPEHLAATVRAAAFIRRRYTICDFLRETGLWEQALAEVLPRLTAEASEG